MKLDYDKSIKHLETNEDGEVRIVDRTPFPYHIMTYVMGYGRSNTRGDNLKISNETLEKFFEPVEDFNQLFYSKTNKDFTSYVQVYKHKNLDYFLEVDVDMNDNWEDEEFVEEGYKNVTAIYHRPDDSDISANMVKSLNELLEDKNNSANKISLVLRVGNNTIFKEHKIKPLDLNIDRMYNDDFKPVHEHIVKNLKEGNKGIFLFHGTAGTGKTNYIKNLTRLVPEKKFVFVPVGVIPHLADPSFISLLIDNKGSVLVLEDCENFIQDRGQTGSNVVSTILNLSDGILSDVLGLQIICTFNADIGKIDEALRRKGRLVDEYEFGKLTKEKASALGSTIGVEVDGEMTIAEVFNAKDNSNRAVSKRKKIGF